jgi:arylsulfatase
VPVWQASPVGPYENWPSPGNGFEHFYGFIGGETDQYYPLLVRGIDAIDPPKTPEEGYTLNEDLATQAIQWIHRQRSLARQRPFFMYYAPGATHAPHHVPAEWSDKYRGKFDQGWDKVREETFARQKALGVIPPDAELTARSEGIPAWDEMPDELKPVMARQMEVYAGFMEQTDHHIGRVLDALEELDMLDETLIYLIIGDNGASAEGSLQGTFNEMITLLGEGSLETPEFLQQRIDLIGTPEAYNHYAVGWAHAMDTPYQWTKQVASHFGGTRNGTVVHWPARIQGKGEIRTQFHHVIDVAPSILEAAGIPEPMSVNGVQQRPMEGVSMLYSFNDAAGAERRETQYFEMVGNRGIYHKGWTAVTRHRTPWLTGGVSLAAFDDDVWELYDTNTDWTQAQNIAEQHPDMLAKLQRQWIIEATKYNVLPLDDRFVERANAQYAGRPTGFVAGTQLLFGGMGRLLDNTIISVHNKSHNITAQIKVPKAGANGVIIAQGGLCGGWSLYVKEGKPKYCYNFYGIDYSYVETDHLLEAGKHQVRLEFTYDGGGRGKGGTATIYVDGTKAGSGRVERTQALSFGLETLDVGFEAGAPVTHDYHGSPTFTGEVDWVQLDEGDDADHFITDEERFRIAMVRQ